MSDTLLGLPTIEVDLPMQCDGDNHRWIWIGRDVLDDSDPPDDFKCLCGSAEWKDRNNKGERRLNSGSS